MEVHRCRFVEYAPEAIHCLSFNGDGSLLAVSRANADIEVWNVAQNWAMQQRIAGGENSSVEALAWIGDRLFSAGLHGQITEWNLHTLQPKETLDSQGGAVWCLSANHAGTRLAVGCEDGCIRLFDVEDGNFTYARTMDKIEGRILSVAWHPDDLVIVSGSSISTINLWNAQTGRSTLRITVEDYHKESTLVWCVAILRDFTIISGDSLGTTQFWDGKFGTLRQSYRAHQADVLAFVVNEEESRVYASGVDSKVVQFSLVTVTEAEGGTASKWVQTAKARIHTHDVRAIALAPATSTMLVSGGVDTQLVAYDRNHIEGSVRKIPPFPHHPFISLAASSRLLLCQYPRKLQIWKLGTASSHEGTSPATGKRQALPLTSGPKVLLEFQPKSKGNIVSSGLSPDGQWLVVSDMYNTRLFKATVSAKGAYSIAKVKDFVLASVATHCCAFTPDSHKLVLCGSDGIVRVLSLPSLSVLGDFDEHMATGPITRIAVSADGQWLATGDAHDNLHVFNLNTNEHQGIISKTGSQHVTFAFHPPTGQLLVACANNQVFVYDPATLALTKWSREHSDKFPTHYLRKYPKTVSITFDPSSPHTAILVDHGSFTKLDLNQDMSTTYAKTVRSAAAKSEKEKSRKSSKENAMEIDGDVSDGQAAGPAAADDVTKQLYTVTRYQSLLYLGFVGPREAVVVERPWLSAMSSLPAPLLRSRYGT